MKFFFFNIKLVLTNTRGLKFQITKCYWSPHVMLIDSFFLKKYLHLKNFQLFLASFCCNKSSDYVSSLDAIIHFNKRFISFQKKKRTPLIVYSWVSRFFVYFKMPSKALRTQSKSVQVLFKKLEKNWIVSP